MAEESQGNGNEAPSKGKGEREKEKCRKTKILRVQQGKYWVDLECLVNASFTGKQWPGSDTGNQAQETIFIFDEQNAGDVGGDIAQVNLVPESGVGEVEIHSKASALFSTWKHNVRLFFINKEENDCRKKKNKRRRIAFNLIDDEFLKDGKPPEEPKKYMEVVKETEDGSDLWLDMYLPNEIKFARNKELRYQEIKLNETFQGEVNLPNSGTKTEPKGPHLVLDPFKLAVNFGPDWLGVYFNDGES